MIQYIGSQFSNPRGLGGKLSTYFMNRLNQRQYKAVVDLYLRLTPKKVLDIGFGNGFLLQKLSRYGQASFYGIEVSEDMVAEACKRNKKLIQRGEMELCLGDVAQIDFPDQSFDFIYTVNTVYFWAGFEEGYSEIYRTLKSGGAFANVFYTKEWLDKIQYTKYGFVKYTHTEMQKKVRSIGFRHVELIELKKDCAYCLLVRK